jgi:DNA-binding transcriptional ArsR family regulator
MTKNTEPLSDFDYVMAELIKIRSDLKQYSDKVQLIQANSFLTEFRQNCAEVTIKGYQDTGCDAVSKVASGCEHWQRCQHAFSALFGESLKFLNAGEVTSEDINAIREKAHLLKNRSSLERCESCHNEANNQLNKQIEMLKAIGIYKESEDIAELVISLPESESAALFNDALSSPIRIHILKLLYSGEKSFTDLSNSTGLRGGNLLFHLEKLQKSGVILKRGEYQMSYRGYEVLHSIANLFRKPHEQQDVSGYPE